MAIFVFKIVALVVRTIAKPLISWATYYNRMKLQEPSFKYHYLRSKIIWVGQMTNFYNTKINRKLFRLSSTDPIKKLTEDKAIEKGAEFISEVLIYTILISLPILEWTRQSKINKIKEQVKEQGIRRMKNDIIFISKENSRLREDLKEIKSLLIELNNKV
jgi:hypothetical protein